MRRQSGFALLEIILLLGILGALVSLVVIHFENSRLVAKEERLKAGLGALRQATQRYYRDHGHFPCTAEDFNRKAELNVLKQQLLWYTDRRGKPSRTRNRQFRFGPYLSEFPVEPISGNAAVRIDTSGSDNLVTLKKKVSESQKAKGGWYYQAKTGFWLANLGRRFFKEYYAYF